MVLFKDVNDKRELLSGEQGIRISSEDCDTFCWATGDPNRIHNSKIMKELRKKPLVPGMLTSMATLTEAHRRTKYTPFNITGAHFVFGRPVSGGSTIWTASSSDSHYDESGKDIVDIEALHDRDPILSTKQRHSYLIDDVGASVGYKKIDFKLPFKGLRPFLGLIGSELDEMGIMAYAIARSSAAIATTLEMGSRGGAKEIFQATMEHILPAYAKMDITLDPEALSRIDPTESLEFVVDSSVRKRLCTFEVTCSQDEPLYHIKSTAVLVPEAKIIEMADDL